MAAAVGHRSGGCERHRLLGAQHAPPHVVEKAEPHLRAAVEAGEATRVALAEIEDRLAVIGEMPQRFGTQWRQIDGGPYEPFPVDDIDLVNERRKELGLGTIAEHAALLATMFGSPRST